MTSVKHVFDSYKIILLGDSAVGKTSLINRFVNKKFTRNYRATFGSDFFSKQITVNDHTITLHIWDTSGQERFQSLGNCYYRNAHCVIFVYDVTRPQTIKSIQKWKDIFLECVDPSDPLNFPFVVVGTKIDLLEGIGDFMHKKNWDEIGQNVSLFLASSKDNDNVDLIFQNVAEKVLFYWIIEDDFEVIDPGIIRLIEGEFEVIEDKDAKLLESMEYRKKSRCSSWRPFHEIVKHLKCPSSRKNFPQ